MANVLLDEPYYANTHACALNDMILLYVLWGASCGIVNDVTEHPRLHLAMSTEI